MGGTPSRVFTSINGLFCPPSSVEEIAEREAKIERFLKPLRKFVLWLCSALLFHTVLVCVFTSEQEYPEWDSAYQKCLQDAHANISIKVVGLRRTCDEAFEEEGVGSHIIEFIEKHPDIRQTLCTGLSASLEADLQSPIQKRLRPFISVPSFRENSLRKRGVHIVLINFSAVASFNVTFYGSVRRPGNRVRHGRDSLLNFDNLLKNSSRLTKIFLPIHEIQSVFENVKDGTIQERICFKGFSHLSGNSFEARVSSISIYRLGHTNSAEDRYGYCI